MSNTDHRLQHHLFFLPLTHNHPSGNTARVPFVGPIPVERWKDLLRKTQPAQNT